MGENGPIQVKRNNFLVKENGEVWINKALQDDPTRIYGKDLNQWEEPILLDQVKLRTVDHYRHLNKEGDLFMQLHQNLEI